MQTLSRIFSSLLADDGKFQLGTELHPFITWLALIFCREDVGEGVTVKRQAAREPYRGSERAPRTKVAETAPSGHTTRASASSRQATRATAPSKFQARTLSKRLPSR